NAGGTVLYESGTPKENGFDPQKIPASARPSHDCLQTMHKGAGGHIFLTDCGVNAGGADYFIQMGVPITETDNILAKVIVPVLIGLPVAMAFAIVGGFYLVRLSLRSVDTMRRTAEQISFVNPSQRLPVTASGDAIEHLSRTLNQMLGRF